ncbi:NAD-dependent epimerase/dehydratase family protein [Halomarina oriensis]|uniref:NAD-dependent epimerase/dehydratase family protein n=1 Tax=Halomarina oriensis TaxID=671145 RepID=A0A6B0GMN1_9EURY|nr:NAD-dependent epimerase/dehydratase family protein [Halomarina oriensis]MWG35181.1 NAD-dependent epimerase/dehydratase family protein [Halomarina oriensis]
MPSALTVGGTRFIGRHTVAQLLAHDYDVTTVTRGQSDDPFADEERVSNVQGDRDDRTTLERARDEADPDVVVDCCAYHPGQVREATDVFADAGAYVYVSSGSAYAREDVPMREGETPLHDCTDEQATDDSMESYGPRKAEGDRAVFEAAADGVNAMSVRPMLVYGPHDYTERYAYWVDRVAAYDRVLVPGDGGSLLHRVYVGDVARALRIVAEEGEAGEAYNVADRDATTLERSLTLAADALDTDVEVVHASEHDLARADLTPEEFVLYTPSPALVSTEKLHALGWDSTPLDVAVSETALSHRERGLTGGEYDPGREREVEVIDALTE